MTVLVVTIAGPSTGWQRGILDIPIAVSVLGAVLLLIAVAGYLAFRSGRNS